MAALGFTCLLGLEALPPIDLYTVRRALSTIAPRAPLQIERRQTFPDEPAMTVAFAGEEIAVHAFRGRIPEQDYFDAVSGNLFWPAAADEMARHTACLVISAARAPARGAAARDQAVAVTRVAVAFSQALPVLGMHWLGTRRMIAPDRLGTAPREIDLGFWPVDLWLGYAPLGTDRPGEPLVFGARTVGAMPFIGCEVEIPAERVPEKIEPIRSLFDAARVLIGAQQPVADAQVIETPGKRGRRWQTRFLRSEDSPVARLIDLGADDPSFA